MDVITLIVDAPPLINRIHGLKQWIYDGSVRIVVPLCTLNEVERQYKSSVATKEAPKEPAPKKASGRASRREEQPLFDINPRTTWEFLCREREKGDSRVQFQKEDEDFSLWKKEEQGIVPAPESQREPPSSFADALLRKLNITDGSALSAPEDEPKPTLISRKSDSGSPRTYQKLPKVSRNAIPANLIPFFSCALWKIYESGDGLPEIVTFQIFTEDSKMKDSAEVLGLGVCDWARLKTKASDSSHAGDDRSTYGELEREFPSQNGQSKISAPCDSGRPSSVINRDHETTNNISDTNGTQTQMDLSTNSGHEDGDLVSSLKPAPHLLQREEPEPAEKAEFQDLEARELTSAEASTHPKTSDGTQEPGSAEEDDSDLDSDEEIIVFNPRAKRGSWRPKTPGGASEPSHSRPATASGPEQKTNESPKPARSPIKSSLKPQSPVFTPGQVYSPAAALADKEQAAKALLPTNGDVRQHPKSPRRSPKLAQAKPHSAKPHNGKAKTAQASTSDERRQQSEMIIQRQREAINRQTNATSKPPPRRVQKEPTDNPTVIDPEAFDRSYVIQPSTETAERGGKRRSGPKQKHGSKASAPPASAPQKEPEDDFVLKSGAPRGSMRGKGKLFVP